MAEEIVQETEWRDIPGWPGYRVSKSGVVQTCKRTGHGNRLSDQWRTMKQADDTRGYKSLGLKNVTKRTWIQVHVLVLMAWVGPRPEGMHGCHNDGNKHNNCLENLRWDTPKANAQDAIKHGTWVHGEKYGGAKLTDNIVSEFLHRVMNDEPVAHIAKSMGIKKATLFNVIYGAWAHVKRPDGFYEYLEKKRAGRKARVA